MSDVLNRDHLPISERLSEVEAQQQRYAEDLARLSSSGNSLSQRLGASEDRAVILLADDNTELRQLLVVTLSTRPLEILEAGNGLEALELARSRKPRIAVLDVEMPELDGVEACRQIKADPELEGTVVIMLTGLDRMTDLERAREAGMDVYLTKPFSPLELLSLIDVTLSRKSR